MYVDYYLPVTSVTLYILLKPKVDSLCTDPPSPPIFIERRGSVHRLKIDLSISEKIPYEFSREFLGKSTQSNRLRDNSREILA